MCFSKTSCWKIFGEMHGGAHADFPAVCRPGGGGGRAAVCEPGDHKSYDSDSGLSDDNDASSSSKLVVVACKTETEGDPSASDLPEESPHEETDHESAAVETATKGLSDGEPGVSGKENKTVCVCVWCVVCVRAVCVCIMCVWTF